jgi:KDO2-lipid IV(A) lauroyltransferase
MKISHGLEFAAVWLLTKIAQIMPGRLADALAIFLGKLAYHVLTSRRLIAAENLRRAMPDKFTVDDINKISRQVFINIGRTTIEFARQPLLSPEKIKEMVTCDSGMEYLDNALKEGTGAVLISGHFGNWELLGGWMAAIGYPLDFLVGQQHNVMVDRLLVSFRRSLGVGIIPIGVAARKMIKSLRSGRMVAVVSDQHAASGGIVVDFFGRPASTPAGPAAFAVKVGCPIIAGGLLREGYNRHRALITEPIFPPQSGNTEQDIKKMTQDYTTRFEGLIRQYPDQWMWTHRRWKID